MKWKKSKKNLNYVRKAGVRQFISQYNKVKNLQGDELLWGDEIEYGVFRVDHGKKEIRLSLRAQEVRSLFSVRNISFKSALFLKFSSEGDGLLK